jgi:DNA polymerase III subunit beta
MLFTVSRSDFARLLSDIGKVVEKRTTIPIINNVLLSASNGALSAKATDLDMEITKSISANVAEPGETTVNAPRLAAIVGKLGANDVTVSMAPSEELLIKAGRSRFTLGTLPVEDFPSLDAGTFGHTFDIDIGALFAPLKYSISSEETRYYLNGIFLHQHSEGLRAVSTDGHKLARNSTELPEGAAGLAGVIIPRKAIDVLSIFKGVVSVSLSNKKIRIAQDGTAITSKLIDGTFPDYERVTPKNNDKRLVIDRAALSSAVDRAATIADQTSRGVKLAVAAGGVTISMRTPDGSAVEEIEAEYSAEPIEVGFNARYLIDTLANCGGDTVAIDLHDPGSPALVRSLTNDNWMGVIMPVRI